MHLCIIIIILSGVLPPICRGLVCYDTVVAEEPVLIGCDFAGSACAVTNKTTTTEIYGRNETVHETLYHCAERSSSCTSGPLNHCTGEQVTCQTSCCNSHKCNQPEDAKFQVKTVPRSKALSCYQLIGDSQKSVKCMYKDAMCFYLDTVPRSKALSCYQLIGDSQKSVKCMYKDAMCFYLEIGQRVIFYADFDDRTVVSLTSIPLTLFSDSTPQKHSLTQLCSTKKFCQHMKSLCSAYNKNLLNFDKPCTATCCSDNHCNPLPPNFHYVGQPHPHAKAVKATHMKGARHTHTTTTTTKDVFVDDYNNYYPVLDDDDSYNVDTSVDYDYSYSNNIGWYVGGAAIALFISIVAATVRYSRRTRLNNVPYRTLQNAQKA